MSLTANELRKIIRELIRKELDEASVTGNIDGGEGPPKTPYAFTKKKKKKKSGYDGGHKKPDILGLKIVKDPKLRGGTEGKTVGKRYQADINEGKYHDYRNDEEFTPKQKIGFALREIKKQLAEVDKVVAMNRRLKKELNVDTTTLWKNTMKDIVKVEGQLKGIATKIRDMI